MSNTARQEAHWLRGALGPKELAALDAITANASGPGGRVDWRDPEFARALAPVADRLGTRSLPGARIVRIVWFSKDATANWGVPWHQDRIIAVAQRHDLPVFRNWSEKRGIWHCEPPPETFEGMRFVRVHLDDCDETNGAMEIARGSEAAGLVPEADAARIASGYPAEVCIAQRGDIQVLPMLVLHRSRPAQTSAPRRALRIDVANFDLAPPLQWCVA
jgi:hypothetical protein